MSTSLPPQVPRLTIPKIKRGAVQEDDYFIGPQARLHFMDTYRRLDKLKHREELQTDPITSYLSHLEKNHLVPEYMGIIRRKGNTKEFAVTKYGMGDSYADALSSGIG